LAAEFQQSLLSRIRFDLLANRGNIASKQALPNRIKAEDTGIHVVLGEQAALQGLRLQSEFAVRRPFNDSHWS
jgi:hypothetical protein